MYRGERERLILTTDGIQMTSEEWRDSMSLLSRSFERVAGQSKGLFHLMVEKRDREHPPSNANDRPPYWKPEAHDKREYVERRMTLPGDPPRFRELDPEEVRLAPEPQENDGYVRDMRGRPHAILERPVIRSGYLTGCSESARQFQWLGGAAGRLFRAAPSDIIALLPHDLIELTRAQQGVMRRQVFGDIGGARPPWMAQGWQAGVLPLENGVIIDHIEMATGGTRGADLWLLLLHRLGWSSDPGSLLTASRWYWSGGTTVQYGMPSEELDDSPELSQVPRHRFYSVLGESQDEQIDLLWASCWAIRELLSKAEKATINAHLVRRQLEAVEISDTSNAKGDALERLMRTLFESVDGFTFRERNLRTETEEIDLVFDNRCSKHPWGYEGPLLLAECKNWSTRVGKDEVVLFKSKMQHRRQRCTVGFLIAWGGFAETVDAELLRSSSESWVLIALDGTSIKQSVTDGSFPRLIEEKWYEALTR